MSSYGSPPPPPPPQPSYGGGGAQGAPPPNYLVWAILATILCGCTQLLPLPLGIAAIVFATQVNSKWAMGDVAGAQEASEKAKKFGTYAALLWLILTLISAVLVATGVVNMDSLTGVSSGS